MCRSKRANQAEEQEDADFDEDEDAEAHEARSWAMVVEAAVDDENLMDFREVN